MLHRATSNALTPGVRLLNTPAGAQVDAGREPYGDRVVLVQTHPQDVQQGDGQRDGPVCSSE
jgi:hypothetical protein